MNTPLFAVIAVVLSIGSFSAGRATAPVIYHYPITQTAAPITHAVNKPVIHRTTVKKHAHARIKHDYTRSRVKNVHVKSLKNHAQRGKAVVHKQAIQPLVVHKQAKKQRPIVLSKQKLNQASFDCTVVPRIAYAYPATTVIKAAADYLPKSSLSKLSYCLNKGGTG
jgi:hypothetical protein